MSFSKTTFRLLYRNPHNNISVNPTSTWRHLHGSFFRGNEQNAVARRLKTGNVRFLFVLICLSSLSLSFCLGLFVRREGDKSHFTSCLPCLKRSVPAPFLTEMTRRNVTQPIVVDNRCNLAPFHVSCGAGGAMINVTLNQWPAHSGPTRHARTYVYCNPKSPHLRYTRKSTTWRKPTLWRGLRKRKH